MSVASNEVIFISDSQHWSGDSKGQKECTKKKSKAISLQAWAGPEDSRRLRLPDFKTISTQRW
jgi:hypothetical protein